jgi:septal ring factor EnvC (AmiA/AmiB activator)
MAKLEKITAKIEREKEKLRLLYAEKEEIQKKITAQEKTVANLEAERKATECNVLGAAAESRGISIAELTLAIQKGDFYALQELMEAQANGQADTSGDTEDAAETDSKQETNGEQPYSSYGYGSSGTGDVNEET